MATEIHWNKHWCSLLSHLTSEIRRPKSCRKEVADSLIGPGSRPRSARSRSGSEKWCISPLCTHPGPCMRPDTIIMPRPGGIKRWCCLTSVCLTSVAYIRSAAGRLDGACWLIGLGSAGLAQGCRCALLWQAWAGAYRGGRPPTACYYKNNKITRLSLFNHFYFIWNSLQLL